MDRILIRVTGSSPGNELHNLGSAIRSAASGVTEIEIGTWLASTSFSIETLYRMWTRYVPMGSELLILRVDDSDRTYPRIYLA